MPHTGPGGNFLDSRQKGAEDPGDLVPPGTWGTITSRELEKIQESCTALKGTLFLGFPADCGGLSEALQTPICGSEEGVVLRNATLQSRLGLRGKRNRVWMGSRALKSPETALLAQVLQAQWGPLMSLGWGKWGKVGWEDAGYLLGACAG